MDDRSDDDLRKRWAQAIDLQKHFNDILFKIRAFFFGLLGTVAALKSGVLAVPSSVVAPNFVPGGDQPEGRIYMAGLLLAPALAVYMLDRFYYHPLLVGAGNVAMEVEKRIPALRLATEVRAENHRHHVLHWVVQGRAKISVFYCMLVASVVGLLFADKMAFSLIAVLATCGTFFLFERLGSRQVKATNDTGAP